MNISDFLKVDVCNYASYDNYRKIGSIADGLKPSARKCVYTVIKNNVNQPKKVSQLKSTVAEQTQYLHGDQSLEGVVVSLAQDFVGTNNIPLFKREGTFGNRLKPVSAAGRYIFTCKEDYLDKIFKSDDNAVLIQQEFEGDIIEPKFYIPIIPLLVINGSVGLTTGFSQKILQRNPKDVIQYIENKLDNKKENIELIPWFNGFSGDIKKNEGKGEGSWIVFGKVKKISESEIEITEIPYDYTLESYIEVLDKLEEDKQIREYKDYSEGNKFRFVIKLFRSGVGLTPNDPNLLNKLKLVSQVTENYTSMNEENKVVEYNSIYEIIDNYYNVRLDYYERRKKWKISEITEKLKEAVSKYTFINGVISNKIIISKKTEEEIIKQIEPIENIIKIDDSYDYLINLPIKSLTKTQVDKLKEQIYLLKNELDALKKITSKEMWKKDLAEFKKVYFK